MRDLVEMALAMAMPASSSPSSFLSACPRLSIVSPASLPPQYLSKSLSCSDTPTLTASSILPPPPPEAVAASTEAFSCVLSRRYAMVGLWSGPLALALALPSAARADTDDEYKKETQEVIEQVKKTLTLEKSDPSKPEAVAVLRQASNEWVAKYRREKKMAGKPSFSNMYSALNAISGHYISFGPASAIPPKRQQRILEEVNDAEKALSRGR